LPRPILILEWVSFSVPQLSTGCCKSEFLFESSVRLFLLVPTPAISRHCRRNRLGGGLGSVAEKQNPPLQLFVNSSSRSQFPRFSRPASSGLPLVCDLDKPLRWNALTVKNCKDEGQEKKVKKGLQLI
jgi:hypothetical protein